MNRDGMRWTPPPAPSSSPAPPALDDRRCIVLAACGQWWQLGVPPRHALDCGAAWAPAAGGCGTVVLAAWDELGDGSAAGAAGVTTRPENHPNG